MHFSCCRAHSVAMLWSLRCSDVTAPVLQLLKENDEEYVFLEESFRDMSLEQLDVTLNESRLALQQLDDEAQSLLQLEASACGGGGSVLDDDSTLDIAAQLRLIQEKQQELMRMQMALHQRLAESKARKQKKKKQAKTSVLEKYDRMIASSEAAESASGLNDAFNMDTAVCENVVDVSPIASGPSKKRQHKTPTRSRGVVDMSPIKRTRCDADLVDMDETKPFRTPEKGASPTLLYSANKRSPLFPPLESTASESVHQPHHHPEDIHEDCAAVKGVCLYVLTVFYLAFVASVE